ncbi:site-specific integrase [Chitinolyticbacter albus]|uniref:site-specific integrase n=1 Tax=Chitinolyticbacter albus TaxID=2961951 RepID=UPI00210CC629|nr:site-specific integrase [Chitinolyticbacter albus]
MTNENEENSNKKKKTNSKKNGFTKFYKSHLNFREEIFNRCSDNHKLSVSIMALTGCRPSELKNIFIEKVDNQLKFTIKGAKVNEAQSRGIKERVLTIAIDEKSYNEYLVNTIENSDVKNTLFLDLKTTLQAISTEIIRTSQKLYKNKYKASSYTFRHAFAEDLKTGGYIKEEIAVAMGHRSVNSQGAYGYKLKTGDLQGPKILSIENKSNEKINTVSKLDKFKIRSKLKKLKNPH